MNSLTHIMSYDKTKSENQENCNCKECVGIADISEKKEIFGNFKYTDDFFINIENYRMICKEKEFLTILNLKYWYKDKKTKNFIWKALYVHGDKYDYCKAKYIKSENKVKIICRMKNHECFLQTPHSHLKGRGCPKCGGRLKLNSNEFIKRAIEIHHGKYDYSKVNYKNIKTKVEIICPKEEHGSFWQTPLNHLDGKGCPKCGGTKKLTLEEFVERANIIHDNLYDYSKVNYKNQNIKVCIICKKHNENYEFWQTPESHLKGQGCPKCAKEKLAKLFKLELEEFVERANIIHNNKYDYSKVKYINSYTKICIICKNHKKLYEFWQTPESHLKGSGCPKCHSSKGEIGVRNFLIKNKINFEEQKTFEDCRYINELRFDFYIPKYNLCIEFDGKQHFIPHNFNSKMTEKEKLKDLKLTQLRDQIKNDYCKKNGINLLRIRYDENIEEKLTEYFQKHEIIKKQTLVEMVS